MKRFVLYLVVLTILFTVIWQAEAIPTLNPANGHYYDAISGSMSWDAAKANAESQTYMGVQGHLATITSQAENDFIVTQFPYPGISLGDPLGRGYWLGGFQPVGPEPNQGWQWVTGELFSYTYARRRS